MKVYLMALAVAIGGFFGMYIASDYKQKMEVYSDMARLLFNLESNVKLQKQPTTQVIARTKFKSKLPDILLSKNQQTQILSQREVEEIQTFFEEIETSTTATALEKIATQNQANAEKLENAIADYEKKGKTYQKLAFLFGVLSAILMI